MVMKAKGKNVDKLPDSNDSAIEHIDNNNVDDGIVMVLFPVETWNKVQEMANRIGMETGAVVSVALEMMEDEMLKKEGKGD